MRDLHQPGRSVAMSTRAMVATSQPMATAVGLDVLRRGGNALDAAVAAAATLSVTEPHATGIGGDCFLLYHDAASGSLHGLNGSGRAPAAATPQALRARGHAAVPDRGILSVTVPGAVHAWETALQRFGRWGLDAALQPAIDCAEQGFAVTPVVADAWSGGEEVLAYGSETSACLLDGERAPAAGARFRMPALARSLRAIAEHGSEALYRGALAEAIVEYSQAHVGLLSLEDLATHASTWVAPIATSYRGLDIYEIPPNGQGIAALMTLNILENAPLETMRHLSAEYVHALSEAFKLATAERDRFICDPAFARVPVEALLSKAFARDQWARIDAKRATAHPLASALPAQRDTVYLTVVDPDRNAVSLINSLFYPWGSGLVAGDTGIVLQNRGAGFVLDEDHPNCIAPGKRPLHTIIPAMAYRGARPVLSFGVMGGHYQPLGQAYVLSNWLDFGLDLQEAVDAPRFMAAGGTLAVERGVDPTTQAELRRRGHDVVPTEAPLGGAQCIFIDWDTGVLQGASDPRKDGCALGY